MGYRDRMGTDDQPLGLSIDIGKILKDVTEPKRRATRSRSTSRSSNDMDAAMRRAVRAELGDVERALRDIADEVVRLRKAQEALADKVARLGR
jgi:predicted  nucleic acid-binding Zn-ribbon protein